jgi:hypothetical protein
MDPIHPGLLQLTLECAEGLKNCDFFSKQDPYALIKCGQVQLLSSTHKGAQLRRVHDCQHDSRRMWEQLPLAGTVPTSVHRQRIRDLHFCNGFKNESVT